MNQTKKRLSIIKLAISITDIEAIQLQILKLSPLKTDEKIQEIIAGLQAENYAQTQALITTYIETPMEEILQRTSQKEKQLKKAEEKDIIEEFDLFITSPVKQNDNEKEMFDFSTLEQESTAKREQEVTDFDALLSIEADDILPDITLPGKQNNDEKKMFDFSTLKQENNVKRGQEVTDFGALLNIEADDILPDNIELKIDPALADSFFSETEHHLENIKENHIDTNIIPKDTFFDTEETPVVQELEKEDVTIDQIDKEAVIASEEHPKENIQEKSSETPSTENKPPRYEAITYIDQKFKNMYTQYPPVEESDENFASVHTWLLQISNEGYSNDEIEEIIKHIGKLTEADSLAEAAQLLLISGATRSRFAQFMLARALYKGDILQKNLPESFTLINRLAMDDDYPEAICDLAQFYEHGIGIGKDKKRAEMLYREAMDQDIQRAAGHYERLRKQNSGFFSAFKK